MPAVPESLFGGRNRNSRIGLPSVSSRLVSACFELDVEPARATILSKVGQVKPK